MNEIIAALSRLFGQVVPWVIVLPWEQALRIRCGRPPKRIEPGIHLRIPMIDIVFRQSVRFRSAFLNMQTLQGKDGVLAIAATVGYAISDIGLLYEKLHHAEETITASAAAEIASYVGSGVALSRQELAASVSQTLAVRLAGYGLAEVELRITDFAYVRTFRILNDGRWTHQSPLTTSPAQQ